MQNKEIKKAFMSWVLSFQERKNMLLIVLFYFLVLLLAYFLSHSFIMQNQILHKKYLREKFCFGLSDYFFTSYDLDFLEQTGVNNFKITLIVFILSVNRKVHIFKLHGERVSKISLRIYSRKVQR